MCFLIRICNQVASLVQQGNAIRHSEVERTDRSDLKVLYFMLIVLLLSVVLEKNVLHRKLSWHAVDSQQAQVQIFVKN